MVAAMVWWLHLVVAADGCTNGRIWWSPLLFVADGAAAVSS
jgi:hypothetical protein